MIGRTNLALGARVPRDVAWVDEQTEQVGPGKGMSVNRSARDIYPGFLPRRLKHLNRNATGNDNVRVFRMGHGPFVSSPASSNLHFRADAGISPSHGEIEPNHPMPLEDYQHALEQTQSQWIIDET